MVRGDKGIETRGFMPSHRGPIFIHASGSANMVMKNIGMTPREMAVSNEHFRKCILNPDKMIYGKIIGMVSFDTALKVTNEPPPPELFIRLTEQELAFGNYELGRTMIFCSHAVEFKFPIPMKGMQSIRDAPPTGCYHCNRGNIPKGSYHHTGDDGRLVTPCYNMIRL